MDPMAPPPAAYRSGTLHHSPVRTLLELQQRISMNCGFVVDTELFKENLCHPERQAET